MTRPIIREFGIELCTNGESVVLPPLGHNHLQQLRDGKIASEFTIPSDQSFIISSIAIPSQPCIEHDFLRVLVGGGSSRFEMPLKLLMDSYYKVDYKLNHLFIQVEQQLAVILDAVLHVNDNDKRGYDLVSKLDGFHSRIEMLLSGHVGLRLKRAIWVPPRQNFGVECPLGSTVSVFLTGFLSRDVA